MPKSRTSDAEVAVVQATRSAYRRAAMVRIPETAKQLCLFLAIYIC